MNIYGRKNSQSGNALIYVLIAIALFAALSFALSRQGRNQGTSEIDEARIELYTMQLIAYARQAKTSIDQMVFSGSSINNLDFTLPSEAGFSTAPYIHKIYHPQGGGLIPSNIPKKAINQNSTNPVAGWYLGSFNNVEWSAGTGTDVILTAHQIDPAICSAINNKITGSTVIPALSGQSNIYLIDDTKHSGTNSDFMITNCAACEGYMSLCVSNSAVDIYSYYTVLVDR